MSVGNARVAAPDEGPVSTAAQGSAVRRWWDRELGVLSSHHPRLDAALRRAWAMPLPILPLIAFVVLGSVGAMEPGGDARWFRTAGTAMIGTGFWDVFADPGLQIGPLYLFVLGLATRVLLVLGFPVLFVLAGLQAAAVTWLALVMARRLATGHRVDPHPAQWAVGLVLVIGGPLADATLAGHPEEILVGLMLVGAALAASRPSGRSVGVWLAAAGGVKLWGVLGAPIVLLGRPSPRGLAGRVVVLGTLTALCYGSFMVLGTVSTFDFEWTATQWSPPSMLASRLGMEGWALRLVQGGTVGLVGCFVALRRWASPLLLVIVVVATRLALDPLNLTYYRGPLLVLVLLWVWTAPGGPRGWWRATATAAIPVLELLPFAAGADLSTGVWFVVLVVVPVVALVRERSMASRSVGAERGKQQGVDLVAGSTMR